MQISFATRKAGVGGVEKERVRRGKGGWDRGDAGGDVGGSVRYYQGCRNLAGGSGIDEKKDPNLGLAKKMLGGGP